MSLQVLENKSDLEKVIQEHEQFFLLKHSLTCPISAEAKQQFESFAQNSECPSYILHVQEARPLSNDIADTYEVKHESPQALLFDHNKIVWNASHWDVTEKALNEVQQSKAAQ
ncbi:bacillithiol system redox-active protein YtxJ [Salinibacillus xinjiangensis]|uniref:Bacillithiol system redox-active protein YtxJ n=1 Tax=Salinibacillus xinjiangensis TaxID=1229268 RepID=A0A6G1X9X5_9BACI|nr:bacillithiol system redox-active protein YtxJ [Salinibacillus xinjiangensis]MRG87729.1 bacillithiol system redox-active protein YtxJ [Salinibacillus xinjiangensis]